MILPLNKLYNLYESHAEAKEDKRCTDYYGRRETLFLPL